MKPMKYLVDEKAWFIPNGDNQFEVLVSGTASTPDEKRLAIVKKAIEALPMVLSAATSYLDAFIDRQKFSTDGQWFLEAINSTSPLNEDDTFTLQFSLKGDEYGMWRVQVWQDKNLITPIFFCRHSR